MPQADVLEKYTGGSAARTMTAGVEPYRSSRTVIVFPKITDGITNFMFKQELSQRANASLKGIVDPDIKVSVIDYEDNKDKVFDYGITEDGDKYIEINTHRLEDNSFKMAAYQAVQCVKMQEKGVCPEEFLRRGIAARIAYMHPVISANVTKNDTPDVIALEIVEMLEVALNKKINPIEVISGKFKLKEQLSKEDYAEFEKANEAFSKELKNSGGIVNLNFKRALALEQGANKEGLNQEDLESEIAAYRITKGIFTAGIKNGISPQRIANAMTPNRIAEEQLKMVIEMAKKKSMEEQQKDMQNPRNNLDAKNKNNIIDKG